MVGGSRKDVPGLLLVEASRIVGDLLVLIARHAVAGLLLDEVESWGWGVSLGAWDGWCGEGWWGRGGFETRGEVRGRGEVRLTFVAVILLSSVAALLLLSVGVLLAAAGAVAHVAGQVLGFVQESVHCGSDEVLA